MDVAKRLLLEARGLVERGWTQHADAHNERGEVVKSWSPDAVRWSLLGALVASFERISSAADDSPAIAHLARACTGLADTVDADSLEEWNDEPGRRQADVLRALDAAAGGLPDAAFVVSPN